MGGREQSFVAFITGYNAITQAVTLLCNLFVWRIFNAISMRKGALFVAYLIAELNEDLFGNLSRWAQFQMDFSMPPLKMQRVDVRQMAGEIEANKVVEMRNWKFDEQVINILFLDLTERPGQRLSTRHLLPSRCVGFLKMNSTLDTCSEPKPQNRRK